MQTYNTGPGFLYDLTPYFKANEKFENTLKIIIFENFTEWLRCFKDNSV